MVQTAFYGILDPATGNLAYFNAGHPPPYLYSAQEDDVPQPLTKTGMALGVTDTETWEQTTAQFGRVMFWFCTQTESLTQRA